MPAEYLMNTATILFLICYLPEFYANYINKNANLYNIFEKVIMLTATSFGLGYAISIKNNTLLYNYAPLITLDTIALFMRSYYAYKNRNINVRVILQETDIENPIHTDIESL